MGEGLHCPQASLLEKGTRCCFIPFLPAPFSNFLPGAASHLQLERKGYFIIDRPFQPDAPAQPMVLFDIPDGRAKTMQGV